jgi:hypothetical protein
MMAAMKRDNLARAMGKRRHLTKRTTTPDLWFDQCGVKGLTPVVASANVRNFSIVVKTLRNYLE